MGHNMSNKAKDILRYAILLVVTYITYIVLHDIIEHVLKVEKLSTQSASLLGAIVTSVTGAWTYVLKTFFTTKVG